MSEQGRRPESDEERAARPEGGHGRDRGYRERDTDRLSHYLGMTRAEFLAKYTTVSEEEGRILIRQEDHGCVFLEGNDCTVYDARPDTCSRFPHLVRGNGSIASRMWQFIDRAVYCPIVYNSLEAFKDELKFKR